MVDVAKDPGRPKEYTRITKGLFFGKDGFKKEESWYELLSYVEFLKEFCREKRFDLEEEPETYQKQEVQLKSFVGSYKFKEEKERLRPRRDIDKLSNDQFIRMITSISQWGAMLGSLFLRAILNVLSPILGEDELTLAYSSLLINHTESALAEYTPPVIQTNRYVASIPVGRILVPQTICRSSSDQLTIVSRRIHFDVESLPVLLLIKFHMEMATKLTKLRHKFLRKPMENENKDVENVEIYPLRIERSNRIYHTNFVLSPSYKVLLEKTYEVDFRDARILSKTWKQASKSPALRDILALWEAYIGKRALTSQVARMISGGYMLKPVCKLYELWVLHTLVEAMRKAISKNKNGKEAKLQILYSEPDGYKTLPADFTFDNGNYDLIYNGGRNRKSTQRIRKFDKWKPFQLRPDYVMVHDEDGNDRVALIADAKYKVNVKTNDRIQMLAYLAYFGETTNLANKVSGFPRGLIVYTGGSDSVDGKTREYERKKPRTSITEICLKPGMTESVEIITDLVKDVLGSA